MNEERLKEYADEYFDKYMSVSFDKFIDNWEETRGLLKYCEQENQNIKERLKQRDEVIDEAISYIDKVQYDSELRRHVYGINFARTKRLLEILQKYKGDNNE